MDESPAVRAKRSGLFVLGRDGYNRQMNRFAIYSLLIASAAACAPAFAADDVEKLENTARQFRDLAERKALLAAAEKDPSKKAALVESADLLDRSADTTQKKADEEKLFSVVPQVIAARDAEAAARARLAGAQEAVDRSRRALGQAANPKQNAENAELYMKGMSEYQAAEEALTAATGRKEAAEKAALSAE
jgi:hypothetical protein